MSDPKLEKVDLEAVRARRARIEREIDLLRAEDRELMMAEAALVRLAELLAGAQAQRVPGQSGTSGQSGTGESTGGEAPDAQHRAGEPATFKAAPGVRTQGSALEVPSRTGWTRPLSQRDYILMALNEAAECWLSTGEVQALVRERWGAAIPTQSMRPLLTNMKQKGDIVRRGRLIASQRRVQSDASFAERGWRLKSA